jgi:tetratricopeptide (TPR) repeat protein
MTPDRLDPEARAELHTLPRDLADVVARHLVAAGLLENAEVAYLHAKEARRLAARVGVVREAVGIAAYRAGAWADALAELRAARRLTGRNTSLAMMADSERALGRLDRALAIVQSPEARELDRAGQIELKIVESGIRRDEGMPDAGVVVLQVPELTSNRAHPWSARLAYAYADALLDAGRTDEARTWFGRAATFDDAGETDANDRFDDLEGISIDDLDDLTDADLAEDELVEDELGLDEVSDLEDPSSEESGEPVHTVTEDAAAIEDPAAGVAVAGGDEAAGDTVPAEDPSAVVESPAAGVAVIEGDPAVAVTGADGELVSEGADEHDLGDGATEGTQE